MADDIPSMVINKNIYSLDITPSTTIPLSPTVLANRLFNTAISIPSSASTTKADKPTLITGIIILLSNSNFKLILFSFVILKNL